jgi:hypothetical protein
MGQCIVGRPIGLAVGKRRLLAFRRHEADVGAADAATHVAVAIRHELLVILGLHQRVRSAASALEPDRFRIPASKHLHDAPP